MSRNGSGVYSIPGTPEVSNTTIDPAKYNTNMTDIASGITESIARDGQTTITANLPMSTFRHTGCGDAVDVTDYATLGQVNNRVNLENKLLNSRFAINQYRLDSAFTPTSTETVPTVGDKWEFKNNISSKLTFDTLATGGPTNINSCLRVTVAAQYSPVSTAYLALIQRIHAPDVIDFGLGTANATTMTLDFYVKGSIAGTYALTVKNSAGSRSYVATYSVTTSWLPVTLTIQGDVTGTWLTDYATTGISLWFDLGSGSNYNATAGTWSAGNYINTTSSVKFCNQTNGSTLYFSGIDLHKGSVSRSYEIVPFSDDLRRCKAYQEKSHAYDQQPGIDGTTPGAASFRTPMAETATLFNQRFQVEKIIIPSFTEWYSPITQLAGALYDATAATDITITSTTNASKNLLGNANHASIADQHVLYAHWFVYSELPGT